MAAVNNYVVTRMTHISATAELDINLLWMHPSSAQVYYTLQFVTRCLWCNVVIMYLYFLITIQSGIKCKHYCHFVIIFTHPMAVTNSGNFEFSYFIKFFCV